jgi:radical SAM superfamily enzyme YgiQ (UPF0313 family)
MRPLDEVVAEIELLKSNTRGMCFLGFLDDNIVGEERYSTELFRRLIPLKVIWAGQASLDVVDMPGMLPLMRKSGCRALFIGFESSNPDSLKEAKKKWLRPDEFRNKVKMLHDHGIMVEGAFIVGFDSDEHTVFEETVEFADRIGVDAAQFSILTPFPGTDHYQRLESEGRIFDRDWSKYGVDEVVYQPKRMSPERLQEGYHWAWREFYSRRKIAKRVLRAYQNWKSMIPLLVFQAQYRTLMRHREAIRRKLSEGLIHLPPAEGLSPNCQP